MIENNTENKPFGSVATEAQIDSGVAEWCWECGNTKCPASKQDILVMCDQFVKRSKEDMEADPHFGGRT